jgi:hypothetical protein
MPFRLFDRDAELLVGTRQIHAVIGLRRAGKTHFLYQVANALLAAGVPKEAVLLVNFEDERLARLSAETLGVVLDAYSELFPDRVREETYVFFDEVQAVPGWERFIARLFEDKRYRIVITGSSSKLLSKEIATALRGRSVATKLYPLSFRELAAYRGVAVSAKLAYSRERFKAVKLLDDYLQWGGFFEVADARDDSERRRIVQAYLDLVVYKDVVERYGIKNLGLLKALIRRFVTNTTRKTSLQRLTREYRVTARASKNTVAQYAALLVDAGFLFEVSKFSHSLKTGNTPSKYYVADPCFKTVGGLNFSGDRGLLVENAVLLELVRRGEEVFFFEDKAECDFVLKRGTRITAAIQVCTDPEVARERELRGLLAALDAFGLDEGTIVTYDYEAEETAQGKRVRYVPLWRWLLNV